MCGICGFIDPSLRLSGESMQTITKSMCDSISHRGPNAQGQFFEQSYGIAMGHRRLSIIDTSNAGSQPMDSFSGRYTIVFNGEIYNFLEIRSTLEKEGKQIPWKGHSDTEVLLASIETWGIERSLSLFNGMFAFALWDKQEKTLSLGRDRCGKKPLYYGWNNGIFLFGSELKAILAFPGFKKNINSEALKFYLNHSYVPSPSSIFEGISKLPQASYCSLTFDEAKRGATPAVKTYWDIPGIFTRCKSNIFKGSESEAVDILYNLLSDAVRLRMISDVPIGAFLSGGIDSALVVSLMQRISSTPIKTFTIGFPGERFDESAQARAIADYLKTDHSEIPLSAADALNVVGQLADIYDEPFADDSQIPTWLVCKNSREKATVALSGDGGDELFAGYESYRRVMKNWPFFAGIPAPLRGFIATMMRQFSQLRRQSGTAAIRTTRNIARMKTADFSDYYKWYMSYNKSNVPLLASAQHEAVSGFDRPVSGDLLGTMQYIDFKSFLTDDVLAKVDRASMNVSLEVRCPILDYRIMEFAWSLPGHLLTTKTTGKLLLRRCVSRMIPQALIDRPKSSFGIPLSSWLRTDLHSWAADLLQSQAMRDGLFNHEAVMTLWKQHTDQTWDHGRLLWNILLFLQWHTRYYQGNP